MKYVSLTSTFRTSQHIIIERLDTERVGNASWLSDSDAVMKNPFHTVEMPINSALFDTRLQSLIATVN